MIYVESKRAVVNLAASFEISTVTRMKLISVVLEALLCNLSSIFLLNYSVSEITYNVAGSFST